jgi:hypothetical protein
MPTFDDVARPVHSRVPLGSHPAGGIAPAIAEPLATLLSQLARQVEGDGSGADGDEDVERAAVAVAKLIVELAVPPDDRGYP